MKTLTQKLEKKITPEVEKAYLKKFERQAKYIGNGIYTVSMTGLYSTDTRELFLMFCAVHEGIKFQTP